MPEPTSNPAPGMARLFIRDDETGKALCVRFSDGVTFMLATEPQEI